MRKKILLVEDEAIIAMATTEMIESHDFQVVTVHDGEQAVAAVDEDQSLSLVLMDIDLGRGMDGTEAAREILASHDIPIIFHTSHSEKEYVDKVKKITRYGYVLKDSGRFVLIEAITMAFELFEAHRQRKRHEEELENTIGAMENTNRTLRTLRECNQVLVCSDDESALIQEICGLIVNTAGYELCWFGYIEGGNERRLVVPAAYAGNGKGYIENLLITVDEGTACKGPTATAVRTKRPSTVNRISEDKDYKPWREAALRYGFQSSIALPLIEEDAVFAVLNIYSSEPDAFQNEEKKHLMELAVDLSYGIRNIRSNHKKKRNENLLDNIIDNLPLGLQIFDGQGYSFRMNKKQRELLGVPSEDVGIGAFNVLTDPYSKAHGADKKYREVYQGRSLIDMENEYNFDIPVNAWETRKERRFFNESIFPVFTRDDQVGFVVSLVSDVTGQRQMLEDLRASERKYRGLFNSIRDAILVADNDRNIIDCNPAFTDLFGYDFEDIMGMKTIAVYQNEEEYLLMGKALKEHQGNLSDFLFCVNYKKKDGSTFPGETNVFYLRDDSNQVEGFIGLIRDISSRKEAEEALINSKNKYKRLIDNSPNMIIESDADTREIISCNPAMAKNLGQRVDSIAGRRIEDCISDETLNNMVAAGEKAIETGVPQVFENELNGKFFYTTCIPVFSNQQRTIQTIMVDFTEQRKSGILLKEYAERLELTMEAANMAWWEMDINSGAVRFDKKKAEMLGYAPGRFNHYEDFTKLLHPSDYEPAMSSMRALLEGTESVYDIEYRIKTFSGAYRWFHDIGTITRRSENGEPEKVSGIVLNVTERHHIADRLKEVEEIIERSGVVIFRWRNDENWSAEFVSENVEKLTGYTREDFLQERIQYSDCIHPEDLERVVNEVKEASKKRSREFIHEPYRIITRQGQNKILHDWTYIQYDDQENITAYKGIVSDITANKNLEAELKKTAEEKESLLKEMNHRVKNNLAMVSSLIYIKDSEITEDLSDLKSRIDVITLVHDKLHKQYDVEHIEARDYFQELLTSVFSSTSNIKVDIVNIIEEVCLPTEMAIPLGLVVNEIATNAVKYAFTADQEACFVIDMKWSPEEQHYELKLSNNGAPFPAAVGLNNPETMGLQLVSTLVSQLRGSIELLKRPHPRFTIKIPGPK